MIESVPDNRTLGAVEFQAKTAELVVLGWG